MPSIGFSTVLLVRDSSVPSLTFPPEMNRRSARRPWHDSGLEGLYSSIVDLPFRRLLHSGQETSPLYTVSKNLSLLYVKVPNLSRTFCLSPLPGLFISPRITFEELLDSALEDSETFFQSKDRPDEASQSGRPGIRTYGFGQPNRVSRDPGGPLFALRILRRILS